MTDLLKLDGVGGALKELREKSGHTTKSLAEELGIDQSTLSKYENGKRSITLELLEQIAKALGQPPLSVVAFCLKHRFPELIESRRVNQLIQELEVSIYVEGET